MVSVPDLGHSNRHIVDLIVFICISLMTYSVEPKSPTFLAPGTGFVEDSFSTDWDRRQGGCFPDDSRKEWAT